MFEVPSDQGMVWYLWGIWINKELGNGLTCKGKEYLDESYKWNLIFTIKYEHEHYQPSISSSQIKEIKKNHRSLCLAAGDLPSSHIFNQYLKWPTVVGVTMAIDVAYNGWCPCLKTWAFQPQRSSTVKQPKKTCDLLHKFSGAGRGFLKFWIFHSNLHPSQLIGLLFWGHFLGHFSTHPFETAKRGPACGEGSAVLWLGVWSSWVEQLPRCFPHVSC